MRTVRAMSWLPLAAVLAVSNPAWAADEEKVVIKTYDLTDLLRPARDYPLPEWTSIKKAQGRGAAVFGSSGGGGGGGGGSPGNPVSGEQAPVNADDQSIQRYEQIIYQLISPGTWKKDGGIQGNIVVAPSNTALIVQHTAEVHRQIEALLAQLREQSTTRLMVRVRASWMVIAPAAVESLDPTPSDGKARLTVKSPDGGTLTLQNVRSDGVDEQKVEAVLKTAELYRQAELTCYNGQTVGVQSGKEEAYVSDLTPVVGTNAVGYDTTVDTVFSGVRLQVTPQLIPNENRVVLDLQSRVTETVLLSRTPVPATAVGTPTTRPVDRSRLEDGDMLDGPADAGLGSSTNAIAYIQRPQVADQPYSTTVRVPLGKRVIVGGMTLPPDAKGQSRTLYLVVRVDAVQ